METAANRYRVADFLKQHPPFNAMEDGDLVALAATGRVKFHEPHEFILWQGEPHTPHVCVIQQGTVSLWDERNGGPQLRACSRTCGGRPMSRRSRRSIAAPARVRCSI